ncbi:hypothetical protein [Dokdonia sp. 4H-3-7-5]|uniref:hypothetical protein n=1 Tax=Dokdonia sp. (strain 4H-3-7-5) TaxID=983548 RepID=UPI00020A6B90|nr:hypothetical protein [Dokdonia sp. 4H-3-7-5]AEE18515.1 hypothetical protein Krodi_0530 [Dokdonia sp. 4H-3-7-5]
MSNLKIIYTILVVFFFVMGKSIAQASLPEAGSLGAHISLSVGKYVPLSNLKTAFNTSPYLGIVGGIKLDDKWRLDPSLTLFFPQSNERVFIIASDSLVLGRVNTLSGHLGGSINRVEKVGRRTFIEARVGAGFSFLQTDTKKQDVSEDSNDNYYGSETVFLNAGLGVTVFAFEQSYVGLTMNYYFTPYNLFSQNFNSSFGNQAISIGITYGL